MGTSDCGDIYAAALCVLAAVSDFCRFQGGYKQRPQAECFANEHLTSPLQQCDRVFRIIRLVLVLRGVFWASLHVGLC